MKDIKLKMSAPAAIDTEKQMIFGWASVSKLPDGTLVEDLHGHSIEPDELEDAVYFFVRNGGLMSSIEHDKYYAGCIVESMVFTKEKTASLGIPEGILPEGWWVGIHVFEKSDWEKVKSGELKMLSIAGKASVYDDTEEDD